MCGTADAHKVAAQHEAHKPLVSTRHKLLRPAPEADWRDMPESLKTRVLRRLYNLWPCYWGTGVRIKYVSKDFREIRIELPLSWRTRNYVGTTFGGSMYGAVDPLYMLMLMKNLGQAMRYGTRGRQYGSENPDVPRSTLNAS